MDTLVSLSQVGFSQLDLQQLEAIASQTRGFTPALPPGTKTIFIYL